MFSALDIAEHLAKQPAHCGATNNFYSVAQHSVLVSVEVARCEGELGGLYGLLHDAARAYGADGFPRVMPAIHGAFCLEWPPPRDIARALASAHDAVELSELRTLCCGCDEEIADLQRRGAKPLRGVIRGVAWDHAFDRFVEAMQVYAVAAKLSRLPVMAEIL